MRKQSLIASPFVATETFAKGKSFRRKHPQDASLHTAVAVPVALMRNNTSSTAIAVLAAARSRFGSDSPLDCHSLPKRRDERNSKNFVGRNFCLWQKLQAKETEGFVATLPPLGKALQAHNKIGVHGTSCRKPQSMRTPMRDSDFAQQKLLLLFDRIKVKAIKIPITERKKPSCIHPTLTYSRREIKKGNDNGRKQEPKRRDRTDQ